MQIKSCSKAENVYSVENPYAICTVVGAWRGGGIKQKIKK